MQLSPRCFAFGCSRTGSRDRLCSRLCPDDVIETEVFAPHHWEDRESSSGVPIQVARLRQQRIAAMAQQRGLRDQQQAQASAQQREAFRAQQDNDFERRAENIVGAERWQQGKSEVQKAARETLKSAGLAAATLRFVGAVSPALARGRVVVGAAAAVAATMREGAKPLRTSNDRDTIGQRLRPRALLRRHPAPGPKGLRGYC